MKFSVTITTPEIQEPISVALLTGSFSQKAAKAVELGFDGVELIVSQPESVDADSIRKTIHQQRLEISAISSGALARINKLSLLSSDPNIRQQAAEKLNAMILFAERVGAPIVTIGSFRGRLAGLTYHAGRNHFIDLLKPALDLAATCNVRLVIEPLNRYETDLVFNAAEGLELIHEINHSHLGLLLDTFHVNIEEISITDCFRTAMEAGRLWHVHIGDSNRFPPGLGHIDFKAIFSTLQDIGYEGYLSAELFPQPDPDEAARLTIAYCHSF